MDQEHISSVTWPVSSDTEIVAFYQATVDELFRSAVRLTAADRSAAEDLVQETYLRLVRAAAGGLVSSVSIGWLVTTMRRRYIDTLRSIGRDRARVRQVAATPTPEIVGEPELMAVMEVLSDLNDRERVAMLLRHVEDLRVSAVADLMGASVGATESLLRRAADKIRRERTA